MNIYFLVFHNIHDIKMVVRTDAAEYSIISPEYPGDLQVTINEARQSPFVTIQEKELPAEFVHSYEWTQIKNKVEKILAYK